MGLDEAAIETLFSKLIETNDRIDTLVEVSKEEIRCMALNSHNREQAILNQLPGLVERENEKSNKQIFEKLDLLFRVHETKQAADLDNLAGRVNQAESSLQTLHMRVTDIGVAADDIPGIKGQVEAVDRRTADYAKFKQDFEHIKNRPGTLAISTLQKVVAGVGALALVVISCLLTWALTRGAPQ